MAKTHNLRNGEKVVEEEVEVDVEEDIITESSEFDHSNVLETIVEKFGLRLREEVSALVESLKGDILTELKKRDIRINALESEVIFLRDALAITNCKLTSLGADVAAMSASLDTAPPSSASSLPTLDTVIAGDSIVKHIDVSAIEGKNKLICLPGARAHKVMLAVKKLSTEAHIKNLVLHVGTNSIPHNSVMQVSNELSQALMKIQLELPNTKIHYSAILPKIDLPYNRGINFVNNFLHDMCMDNGIGFVQHSAFCVGGRLNKKLYAPSEWREERPIHPSHEGALLMQTNIKLHLIGNSELA
jgi:hypothetical protein